MKHIDTTSDTGSMQYTNTFFPSAFIKKYHSWPIANTSYLLYEKCCTSYF